MSSVGWAILLVGLGLAADVAWTEYRKASRDGAAKRVGGLAAKLGRLRF